MPVPLTDRNLFQIAVAIFGVSMIYSIFLWRNGFREDSRKNYLLLLSAFVFHSISMFQRGFSFSRCPVNNLYEATIFILWTVTATYLVVGLWPRLRFLGAFASPLLFSVGVFALFPALDPPRGPRPEFAHGWETLHAALFVLSYGAFGLGSCAGLMYLTQEHDLKFHKLRAVFSLMPPIQRLEVVTEKLLLAGFVLLTAGLVISFRFLKLTKGSYMTADFKVIWTLLVWALYGVLVVTHWKFSQRGRRFAWGAVGAFVFVLLTFWGSNMMSALHNPTL